MYRSSDTFASVQKSEVLKDQGKTLTSSGEIILHIGSLCFFWHLPGSFQNLVMLEMLKVCATSCFPNQCWFLHGDWQISFIFVLTQCGCDGNSPAYSVGVWLLGHMHGFILCCSFSQPMLRVQIKGCDSILYFYRKLVWSCFLLCFSLKVINNNKVLEIFAQILLCHAHVNKPL